MDKLIKVGIAGFGRSGYGIHANYLKHDQARFKVVAVADADPERRADAVREFGAAVYGDYQEMLAQADFDLFVNATPSRFHVEASQAALTAGRHVLAEKPSAFTVADFNQLLKTARKARKVFYPFQNSRFYPFFIKMREVIASGVLGEIISIRTNWSGFSRRWDWQTLQREGAGNLWNTGPHPVDQAIVLFGEGKPKVFCRMHADHYPFEGDANNFCALTLYGAGHPTIEIVLSSFQAYPQGEMYNVSGTRGGLTGGPSGLKWKYYRPEEAPAHEFWRPWSDHRQYCTEPLPWHEESWAETSNDSNATGFVEIVATLYGDLYEVLVNGKKPEIKHEQVRRQIAVMVEAHRQNPLPQRSP